MDPLEPFLKHPKLQPFLAAIGEGENLLMEGLWDSPKALLAALAMHVTGQHVVFFTAQEKILSDFPYFGLQPLEFPAWETLPSEEIPPSPDVVGERYKILKALQESQRPQLICASLQSVLQKILPPQKLLPLYLEIKKGGTLSFEKLPEQLTKMGYHRKAVAADKGEFALRGGIIDIYPVASPDPCRIEFSGDEIISLRHYDPVSQTSVRKIDTLSLTPAEEYELLHQTETLATLFDYLGPHTLIIFDDLEVLEDKYVNLKSMLSKQVRTFLPLEELFAKVSSYQKLYFTQKPLHEISEIKIQEGVTHFTSFSLSLTAKRWRAPFLPLIDALLPPGKNSLTLEEIKEILEESGTESVFVCSTMAEREKVGEKARPGYLSKGFFLFEPSYALVSLAELTQRYEVRRQKQRSHYHTVGSEMLSLTPGEAIVHMNNGIGRYLGVEKRPNHLGKETEFLLLEYAEGAKLYVPMEQAHLISKYIGSSEAPPTFHTLGSSKWQKNLARSEMAIIGYAEELLKAQAERIMKGGFSYPIDGEMSLQFAREFPYVETADQLLAIDSIRKDMESEKVMDRLICGDVGYGKTEVAMRAAFKAVLGGKQVALLVPTTVLAMQHFESFSARMAGFPVKVAQLSRMTKPKEVTTLLRELKEGTIDILVGTHRIVSDDVQFRDLGLLIIDEEQRFGVRVKESLRNLKKEIDCLTLTATPIPRTLYMSLVGARDLSLINTPPEDRLPIQSLICPRSDEVIRNALLRELARDGQAYVIHNRIETLPELSLRIQQLIPAAKVLVAHGQMPANQLDDIFHTFRSGEANVLIATAIIENGIDIPRANTILIDRAEMFGMADLYQMRGRVGRWNKKAYCYFMVSNPVTLADISRKRLAALVSSSGQGGGMKIAMHDLELRGAGNILGTEQSGHVQTIGFHFYCKLLKKAVQSLSKKKKPLLYTECKIEFPFDARLPEEYVNDVTLRMELYQRLGDADTSEAIDRLMQEIADRFGPLPEPVLWLQVLSRLRLFASQHTFQLIKLSPLSCYAEQSHGKEQKICKKFLFKLPSKPAQVEEPLLAKLKENFYLTEPTP